METQLLVEARIVNPLTEPAWDRWLEDHPDATVFHTSAWARVLVESYGHQPCYLRIGARGQLLALVPLIEVQSLLTRTRGVCLPFSDSCDALSFSSFGVEAIAAKLRQIARERGWSYLELRGGSIVPAATAASETYCGNKLDLSVDLDNLFAGFTSATRGAIRKAEQNKLAATIHTSMDALNEFYRLHTRTRRRHGAPPQPRGFFQKIQEHILNTGKGFIVLVKDAERVIAAAMFFHHQSRAIYKFGASDERYLRLRANNLAMWEAIKHLVSLGVSELDFGRTQVTNTGLRHFKQSWGTTEELIHYYKFQTSADRWIGAETSASPSTLPTRVFRALPVALNRIAGAMIYPHLD